MYKRATAALVKAGITDIQIDKSLYGARPMLIGVKRQISTVFATPELAVAAVLAGFRPTNHDASEIATVNYPARPDQAP